MAFSPSPNFPFTLPTTRLTIQPTQDPRFASARPHLVVKITPHLLIPCPPLSLRPNKHRIEDVVDIVLPTGGKVSMDVKVPEEGYRALPGSTDMDHGHLQDQVRDRVREVLLANQQVLGLLHIPSPSLAISQPTSLPSQPQTALSALYLSLSAAQPTCSPLTKNLIPTGHLVAHLTALNLSFEWSLPIPRKKTSKRTTADEEGQQPTEESPELERQEEGLDSAVLSDPSRSGDTTQHLYHAESSTDLPLWATQQVNQALKRVIKQYMIKRFPLIFDAPLQAHSTSFTLHRSITDSLTKFINTARAHDTTLRRDACGALQTISQVQARHLTQKIMIASNLSGRKRRQRAENLTSGDSAPSKDKARAEQSSSQDVVEEYLAGLPDRIVNHPVSSDSQAESQSQARSQRSQASLQADKAKRRNRLILDEAVGKIGRSIWEGTRARGRMSVGRIKLVVPGESSIPLNAAPQPRTTSRRRIRNMPSIFESTTLSDVEVTRGSRTLNDVQEDIEEMIPDLDNSADFRHHSHVHDPLALSSQSQSPSSLIRSHASLPWGLVGGNQVGSYHMGTESEYEMIYSDDQMIDNGDRMDDDQDDEMIRSEYEDGDDEMVQDEDYARYNTLTGNYEGLIESDNEMIQSDEEERLQRQFGRIPPGTPYMDSDSSQSQCGSTQMSLSPATSYSSVFQSESLPESPAPSIDALYQIKGLQIPDDVRIVGDTESLATGYEDESLATGYEDDEMIGDEDDMVVDSDSPDIEESYKISSQNIIPAWG